MNPAAPPASPPGHRVARVACLALCAAFALAVNGYFHNRVWVSYDDGAYLHVADRMVHGEVLNRDVQDVHAGYINFVNAWSLRLFGNDAVSPRYPLLLAAVSNAAAVFWLLLPAGLATATVGSLATSCLTQIQFMNPSANWYALSVTLWIVVVMSRMPADGARGQFVLGLLTGVVFLFRQLTGVFVAAAVLVYLLAHLPRTSRARHTWLARGACAVVLLGFAAYLLRKVDPGGFLMYGVWPLGVLLWAVARVRADDRQTLATFLRLAAGAAASALPLAAYHVYHGSARAWLDDAVFGAMSVTRLGFIDDLNYWSSFVESLRQAVHPRDASHLLANLFWVAALPLPVAYGALVVVSLWRGRAGPGSRFDPAAPLPVMAVFYMLVSLHYQKYMYFFFAAPLAVVGLLAATARLRPAARATCLAFVLLLSSAAVVSVAGPTVWNILGEHPVRLVRDHDIPRCSLWLDAPVAADYRKVLDTADRYAGPDDTILALPVHPELYYLTGRRNPVRFYNTAFGLRTDADLQRLLRSFEHAPPRLVFYNPRNHYNTRLCRVLMQWVEDHSVALEPVGEFKVYRLASPRDGGPAPARTREAADGS